MPSFWRNHPTMQGIRVSRTGRVQTRWKKVRSNNYRGDCMKLGQLWRRAAECRIGAEPRSYLAACLFTPSSPRRWKNYAIHRLVLETFVGPCPPGMYVCHNNGNPKDNRLENLRYDTPAGNSADMVKHGTRILGSSHRNAKLNEEQVKIIVGRLDRGEGPVKIARDYNVSNVTITYIDQGRTWTHISGRTPIKTKHWTVQYRKERGLPPRRRRAKPPTPAATRPTP